MNPVSHASLRPDMPWSAELGPGPRAALVGLVLLAHGLLAWVVLNQRAMPRRDAEPLVITAQVVSEPTQAVPASPPRADERAEPSSPKPVKTAPAQVPAKTAPPRAPEPLLAAPRAPTPPAQALTPDEHKAAAAPATAAPTAPTAHAIQQPVSTATNPPATAPGVAPAFPAGADAANAVAAPKELPMSAVRYLTAPPSVYPRASMELGETGVVLLKVLVDEDGRPRTVQLLKSSGFPRLDRQAMQNMNAARFQPHMEGGVARPVWVPAEIVFKLE